MPQCQLIAIAIATLTYLSLPAISTARGEVMRRGTRSRLLPRGTQCALNETTTVPAGEVRNLQAHCKYNTYREHYYYQFTWDPPNSTGTRVIRYRVAIWKGMGLQHHRCYQVNAKTRHFLYNASVGFEAHKEFKYQVTAQPIKRNEDGSIHMPLIDAPACPIEVKLVPLQNVVVPYGANVTFKCKFELPPFPKAQVSWQFSRDKIGCAVRQDVFNGTNGMSISKDRKILRINNAQEKHIGCYVLKAANGVGEPQEEKGYLDLNASTVIIDHSKKPFWEAVGPLFGLLTGTVLLVVAAFVIVMYKCFNTPKFKEVVMPLKSETSNKKVYISHCAEDENEKTELAQLACMIKSWLFDVVIDVCCEVQITDDGGFSRWIPNNMKTADKVIVVITPSYLRALQSNGRDLYSMSEDVRKVNSEFNYITNILYNDLHYSKKVLIIAKGVKPSEFPFVFKNKFFIEFPAKLDVNTDMHFRSIMGVLLEEEPLQLKDGHPHVLTHG